MNNELIDSKAIINTNINVAVIGGGVAGCTIALRLAELGINTTIIEKDKSLVNGPPFCHLHAGGNLYREITDEQCITLLNQSIDTAKVFPEAVNLRPTVIALPRTDQAEPKSLLPRLEKLRDEYANLVERDITNKVLGEPKNYFRFFSRQEIEILATRPIPDFSTDDEDWLISFAKYTDLNAIKFPVVLVQEYGLSAFRFAAIAELAIKRLPHCHLQKGSQVNGIAPNKHQLGWRVTTELLGNDELVLQEFDYLINACGFRTGVIDDMLCAKRQRLVEFKAAYVAHWSSCKGLWPEVVFYGERGTPQGMAQLTPYPDGYFQLHGMTEEITLFEEGLVSSSDESAQPKLATDFIKKIDEKWSRREVNKRTLGSIEHLAQFIPKFSTATVAARPLFGAQQIPGDDPSLRTGDVSFHGNSYARAEIVKASSALAAADAILNNLVNNGLISEFELDKYLTEHYFPISQSSSEEEISKLAVILAKEREYPEALAK